MIINKFMLVCLLNGLKQNLIVAGLLGLLSCSNQSPVGDYSGEIKDWVHEVFSGKYITSSNESPIELILRQTPNGMLAEMTFSHPQN